MHWKTVVGEHSVGRMTLVQMVTCLSTITWLLALVPLHGYLPQYYHWLPCAIEGNY